MYMKKKILLLLMLLIGCLNINAFEADGITYKITSEENLEVEVRYDKYSGDIVIPESVTYNGTTYSVTAIGNEAFNNCPELTSVEISNSLKSIGYAAFRFCSSLTDVFIPNSVTSIGSEAFRECI